MAFKLSKRSMDRLTGVHPDLVAVVHRAISRSEIDFVVIEGVRTAERQRQLVKAGASKTMDSRHLTGHAVDLAAWVGGTVRWDWPLYLKIAEAMRAAAIELGTPIRWGGTWGLLSVIDGPITTEVLHKKFPDGPHFEINPKRFP
jgi:peptidoglycan L-alanyl-D-glutamate endopeptidase CwlK